MKAKKHIKIVLIIGLILIMSAITISYAIYKTEVAITYTTETGSIRADITVDYDENYTINGIPYFYVTVTNKEDSTLTDVDMSYTLTITDNDNGNGIFAIIEDGEALTTAATYSASNAKATGTFTTEESSKKYKVFVKTTSSNSETINALITLNATQTE